MNQKQLTMPVGGGRNTKGCLEVLDGLLLLAPRIAYVAKDTITFADRKLIVFAQEIDHLRCGFFWGIELLVVVQQPSELLQSSCLS